MATSGGKIIFNQPKDQQKDIEKEQKKRLVKSQEEEEEYGSSSKPGEDQEKLEKLINQSERVLLRAFSIFPFDFFPDELVIDASKIDIIYRDLLGFYTTHTVPIEDVVDVSVEAIPFFATLKITDKRYMESQEFQIRFLKLEEAIQAKRIIQGLIVAKSEGIDITNVINDQELLNKLEKLGQIKG